MMMSTNLERRFLFLQGPPTRLDGESSPYTKQPLLAISMFTVAALPRPIGSPSLVYI